jgi:metal-responsive CopG/Arc/MetJ family transcriptional regulator
VEERPRQPPRFTPSVIPGYTAGVKTAISLPDGTFDRVSARARALGMSRSEFFTRAVGRYLDELDQSSVTAQVDAALATASGADDRQLLGSGDDW